MSAVSSVNQCNISIPNLPFKMFNKFKLTNKLLNIWSFQARPWPYSRGTCKTSTREGKERHSREAPSTWVAENLSCPYKVRIPPSDTTEAIPFWGHRKSSTYIYLPIVRTEPNRVVSTGYRCCQCRSQCLGQRLLTQLWSIKRSRQVPEASDMPSCSMSCTNCVQRLLHRLSNTTFPSMSGF